jgi:hypothetical protein
MRWIVLQRFQSETKKISDGISSCFVVGGTEQDPEYQHLKQHHPECAFQFLGLEAAKENFTFLDLNSDSNQLPNAKLVLCSQVLEHVWNHESFFWNLSKLTEVDGYLWLNVPMSNFVHGSPDYFSAGFTPDYLEKNLKKYKFEVITSGSIGSKRYYIATHILQSWLTEKEHANPILGYHFQPGSKLGVLRKLIIDLVKRTPLLFISKKLTDAPRYATESYVLARRLP